MEKGDKPRFSSGFVRAAPPVLGADSVRAKVIKAYRRQAGLSESVAPAGPAETATGINADADEGLDLEALLDSQRKAA